MKYIAITSFFTEDRDYQKGDIYEVSDFIDQNQIDEFVSLNYIEEYTGGTGGTDNYQALNNKPRINGVILDGNKSSSDLNIPTPINYTAGTGIDITGNVISATGGSGGTTYTAGDNIQISADDVISATDTTYTAGQNVTITSANVINAIIDLTDYYNKTEVNDLIAAMSAIQMEIVEYLPETGASNTIYLLDTGSNSYEQYVYTNSAWQKIGDTSVDLSNYVTIPMMQSELSKKQDKLIAGNNITISNDNKISAVDTKYYAGTNISINSGNVISATVPKYTGGNNVSITNTGVINAVDTKYTAGEGMRLNGTTFSALPYTGGDKVTVNNQRVISVDLTDYYNKTQVNHLLENLDSVSMKVVLDLPAVGVKNIIYLVRMGEENFYNQYIYSDNEWYNIGTTQIDLDNYYTKAQANELYDEKQDKLTVIGSITVEDATVFTSVDFDNKVVSEFTGQDVFDYTKTKMTGAVSSIIETDLPSNRAMITDPYGKATASPITATEVYSLLNIESNVQNQLDNKQIKITQASDITTISDNDKLSKLELGTNSSTLTNITAKTLFDYMWKKIYPVGSIYTTTDKSFNPGTSFGGTWTHIGVDRVLWGVATNVDGGSTLDEQLPDIRGHIDWSTGGQAKTEISSGTGAFNLTNKNLGAAYPTGSGASNSARGFDFRASYYKDVYKLNASVRPNAYTVHFWRRTA